MDRCLCSLVVVGRSGLFKPALVPMIVKTLRILSILIILIRTFVCSRTWSVSCSVMSHSVALPNSSSPYHHLTSTSSVVRSDLTMAKDDVT